MSTSKKKQNKTAPVFVRFDEKTHKELQKEADAEGLDLAPYIRKLVFTHQDRKK